MKALMFCRTNKIASHNFRSENNFKHFHKKRLLVSDHSKLESANGYPYDGKNLGKVSHLCCFLIYEEHWFFFVVCFSGSLFKNRWQKFKW